MSAAFTPGPWEPVFGAAHPSVAGLRWVQITPSKDFPLVREYLSEADANLIASAPDLYEIADLLDRSGYGMSREHRRHLREACAKARGEQVPA